MIIWPKRSIPGIEHRRIVSHAAPSFILSDLLFRPGCRLVRAGPFCPSSRKYLSQTQPSNLDTQPRLRGRRGERDTINFENGAVQQECVTQGVNEQTFTIVFGERKDDGTITSVILKPDKGEPITFSKPGPQGKFTFTLESPNKGTIAAGRIPPASSR